MGRVLRHPLVVGAMLAIISGIVASVVIPALTRVWQDRPRELALKRGLIEKISESVTDPVIRTRYFAGDVGFATAMSRRRTFFTATNREWQIDSGLVRAQLVTYFHGSGLRVAWRKYEQAVTEYLIYATNAGAPRYWLDSNKLMSVRGSRKKLVAYFQDFHFRAGSIAEQDQDRFVRTTHLDKEDIGDQVELISDLLLVERDQLASRLVDTRASGFSHGFWIFK